MQSVSDAKSLVLAAVVSFGRFSTDNIDAIIDSLPSTRDARPAVVPAGRDTTFLVARRDDRRDILLEGCVESVF